MRTIRSIAVATVVLVAGGSAAAALAAAPTSTPTPVRDMQGCVVAVHRDANTFRVRDQVRGVVTVQVTTRTRFEHMAGLAAVRNRVCLHIRAQRSGNVWLATSVAPATKQAARHAQGGATDPAVRQHDGTPDRDRIQAQDRDGTCDRDQLRDRDRISQ